MQQPYIYDPLLRAAANCQAQREQEADDTLMGTLYFLGLLAIFGALILWLMTHGAFNPALWAIEGN